MPEESTRSPWRSVRIRITAAATVVVGVTMLVASFALVAAVRHQLVDRLSTQNRNKVQAVVKNIAEGVPPDLAISGLPPAAAGFVQVQDEKGHVVKAIGFAPGTVGPGGGAIFVSQAAAPPGEIGTVQLESGQTPLSVTFKRVATARGPVTVFAGAPLDGVQRSIAVLEGSLAFGFPVLIAIVAALAWVLTGRALHPVEAMRAEVEAITGGTLHRRVPEPDTGDEVSRLARTMNAMLDRLEGASSRQRQFVSDASHELRSPVAAIRTHLEVGLAHPDATDWPTVARKALYEEARLEALVADLLLLASVDEQRDGDGHAVPVDVGALVREEAARTRPVPVGVTVDGAAVVNGNPDRLARVVANVLDNAARYASSAVHVTVATDDEHVRVTVDDDGPGIAPPDRDRVFERFTRLDASRVRETNGSGSAGLGLALAKAIVDQHHGTITVGDARAGGASFVIALPR
jgi:signal transduction histidine kinase